MSQSFLTPDFCPYKGLEPYNEEYRDFFFGRERDQQTIISNLYATPLTILYGASGVGKSSVLMAGVVPQLRESLKLPISVFRHWQGESFVQLLKEGVLAEVRRRATKHDLSLVEPDQPFDIFLAQCAEAARSPVFLILDQFEEYFLYHPPSDDPASFDAQLARAINRRDVEAKFLLSMREEGLSKLDRFRARIPNLLGNTLRLHHLDHAAAARAVSEPLKVYNGRVSPEKRVEVEPALLKAVLRRAQQQHPADDDRGQGAAAPASPHKGPVETPILQILLTRVWEEESRLWEGGRPGSEAGGEAPPPAYSATRRCATGSRGRRTSSKHTSIRRWRG